MAESPAPDNKKRKLTRINNHKEAPIIFLNVGGAKRNVRRSIWNELRDASCGKKSFGRGDEAVAGVKSSGSKNVANPLCDLVLMGAEHWSDVPTSSDEDGTIRIYLDRNPQAFDDLLEYIEYGKVFLEGIVGKDDNGARLKRLQMECDYFTVDGLSEDVDEVIFGEAVSFRSDDWFRVAGSCARNAEDEVVGWYWRKFCGNESIATRGSACSICDVKTTGTYLMLFSLYSVAVMALSPGTFYPSESDDEFVKVSVFHELMTQTDGGDWMYPLVRCGAFDYRENKETRENEPLLFTAAFAEPISLKKGNRIHCAHGTGVIHSAGSRIEDSVNENSVFSEEEPHCLNFITLLRVFGDSISKWSVAREKDPKSEPSVVKWVPAHNDFPKRASLGARIDENDNSKIRFHKAGYYLLLGRIAARLKKNYNFCDENSERMGSAQLELRTNGGLPLQINSEIVSYPRFSMLDEPLSYNKKMVEYCPINDIIYAERDSYISVRATGVACFARHGTSPGPTAEKIPTQSLSAMRLDNNMRVDRYQVSYDGEISYNRALGGGERVPNQAPLFAIGPSLRSGQQLTALEDCKCIVIGCLSSLMGSIVSLYKNRDAIVHSQLCCDDGHGHGSHTLNSVVEIKANDTLSIDIDYRGRNRNWHSCSDEGHGHLAFLVLQ